MRRYRVAFICTKNAFRSQIAEGFAKALAPDVIEPFSGGSEPAGRVDPLAAEAMAESGTDISGSKPKSLPDGFLRSLDLIVHMGCGPVRLCPNVPGVPSEDWGIPDPTGGLENARSVREAIRKKVEQLASRLRTGKVVAEPELRLEL